MRRVILRRNKIYLGDCLDLMKGIPNGSIDMILADPPYGTTACKWDSIIPFKPMWRELKRVVKSNGVIVLMASQPFTSALVMSNIKMFKYEWIWNKKFAGNFATSKYQPLKIHENIVVFSKTKAKYNPQMIRRKNVIKSTTGSTMTELTKIIPLRTTSCKLKYPESILVYPRILGTSREKFNHPTQKSLALFEYLIDTYTNKNELVLDFCIGSGTTAIAAMNRERDFIGIEKEEKYFKMAKRRIKREAGIFTDTKRYRLNGDK